MEADWDLEHVSLTLLSESPPGLRKFRKYLWIKGHARTYRHCMKHSSVALLQGADVYHAYSGVAPNPRKVLNVQITDEDRISRTDLARKVAGIRTGRLLRIVYAGRVTGMKGPEDWLEILHALAEREVDYHAVWYGGGHLLTNMRAEAERRRLGGRVAFAGNVEREVARREVMNSDLFLFCHKTLESPRCLVESLAAGTPIVGYSSLYARDLVSACGGGAFADMEDQATLLEHVVDLDKDRDALAELIEAAYRSSLGFDREAAIRERIALIKQYAGSLSEG